MESIVDDFGDDPVARMTAEGPLYGDERFTTLSSVFDPDELCIPESSKEACGESIGEGSDRSSYPQLGNCSV